MTIRTIGGQWLISGGGLALSEGCCCDGPETAGDCNLCSCYCVIFQGRNSCEPGQYPEDPTDFFNVGVIGGTRELWGGGSFTREQYSNCSSGACLDAVVQFVTLGLTCGEDGRWTATAFSDAFTNTDPPGAGTSWQYSQSSVVRGVDGCPEQLTLSGKTVVCGSGGCGSVDPLEPEFAFAACPPVTGLSALSLSVGPGSELKSLLASVGIRSSPTCKCNKMATQMDAWGPDESERRVEQIVDVMQQEAATRKLPFLRAIGRKLVRIACQRARRKSSRTGH